MQQLGELQRSPALDPLRQQAAVYVINRDTPEESQRLKQMSGITLPVLLDPQLSVARAYDMLPKSGQPMGGMTDVGQMGFVIIDGKGVIRAQREDIYFGRDAGQLLQIVQLLQGKGNGGRATS